MILPKLTRNKRQCFSFSHCILPHSVGNLLYCSRVLVMMAYFVSSYQ